MSGQPRPPSRGTGGLPSDVVHARATIPTPYGQFDAVCVIDQPGVADHLVMIFGDIGGGADVLLRIHSECLTGDVFGSRRCDCGSQLSSSLEAISDCGRGMVIYLLGHEGRGIGIMRKIQAYELQEAGLDTVDANLRLDLPVDARDYTAAGTILTALGVSSVRLITNNPDKVSQLRDAGITVTARVSLPVRTTPENLRYLVTKRDRMGHDLPGLPAGAAEKLDAL